MWYPCAPLLRLKFRVALHYCVAAVRFPVGRRCLAAWLHGTALVTRDLLSLRASFSFSAISLLLRYYVTALRVAGWVGDFGVHVSCDCTCAARWVLRARLSYSENSVLHCVTGSVSDRVGDLPVRVCGAYAVSARRLLPTQLVS